MTRNGLVAALALLVGWGVPVRADTNSGPAILFIHCRIQGQAVTALRATQTPGVVKPPGPASGEIEYTLRCARGKTLWRGVMDDPRVQRFDYEDPPGSGRRRQKIIRLDAAEFVVRVPVHPEARWVEFRKAHPNDNEGAPPNGPALPPPVVLGRFALPPAACAPP